MIEIEIGGTYRVVCAHLEPRRSTATGRFYKMATLVVIEGPKSGALIYKPLVPTGAATWVWEGLADNIDALLGMTFIVEIDRFVYPGRPPRWQVSGGLIPEATP